MYGYIYKCTYKKNGKFYIGAKTGNKVNLAYYGSGSKWNEEVVSKCNPNIDIQRDILQWCESVEELNKAEQYWIDFYDATNPDVGYNIQKGGNMPTMENRQNMSEIIHNGMTEERKAKISKGLSKYRQQYGLSESHRKHISESLKGIKHVNYDFRNIGVFCVINDQLIEFHNKKQAAKWWYDNYSFSTIYSESTYKKAMQANMNNTNFYYKHKLIDSSYIHWFEITDDFTKEEPIYCLYNNKRYDFKNKYFASIWWHYNYPLSKESYNRQRYVTRITASINKQQITYHGWNFNKIQWFMKGSVYN